jgi:hypothetical protein
MMADGKQECVHEAVRIVSGEFRAIKATNAESKRDFCVSEETIPLRVARRGRTYVSCNERYVYHMIDCPAKACASVPFRFLC